VNMCKITTGGIYTVVASNSSGCTGSATVNIVMKPLPIVDIQAINEFCKGKTVLMQANGGNIASYTWSGGGTNITKTTTEGGTYTVTVRGTNGCTNTDTHVLVQNPLPTPNAGADFSAYPGAPFQLNATGGGDYQWSQPTSGTSNTLSNLTDYNPTGVIYETQTYNIIVTDAKGCTASDQITITLGEVLECLGQSEGITPNGDGYNDTWSIGCLAYFKNKVQIFNRWGQPLFSAQDYGHPGVPVWEATENGVPVPDGTYYYIITITTKDTNKPSVYKGNVTIIR
jgi:gliding motility-associated-like protein